MKIGNNKENQIKVDSPEYVKKSSKSFIITMILSLLAGGILGFMLTLGTDLLKDHLINLRATITDLYPSIQVNVIPWIMLVFTVICTFLGGIWINKGKQQIHSWDGEDDDHINIADQFLNKVSTVSSVLTIGIQILFALTTYSLISTLEKTRNFTMIIVAIVLYFVSLFISMFQQSQVVKLAKQYAPEKQGSVYDKKFHDVWYASCDEAERQLIGEASYQTFRFMNKVFSSALAITGIAGMFIPIGILCAFVVGVLWLIMSCYYARTCTKLEKGN